MAEISDSLLQLMQKYKLDHCGKDFKELKLFELSDLLAVKDDQTLKGVGFRKIQIRAFWNMVNDEIVEKLRPQRIPSGSTEAPLTPGGYPEEAATPKVSLEDRMKDIRKELGLINITVQVPGADDLDIVLGPDEKILELKRRIAEQVPAFEVSLQTLFASDDSQQPLGDVCTIKDATSPPRSETIKLIKANWGSSAIGSPKDEGPWPPLETLIEFGCEIFSKRDQATHSFKPGEMGITYDDDGFVQEISADGRARFKGIQKGDQIVNLGIKQGDQIVTKPYSKDALAQAEKGGADYDVTVRANNNDQKKLSVSAMQKSFEDGTERCQGLAVVYSKNKEQYWLLYSKDKVSEKDAIMEKGKRRYKVEIKNRTEARHVEYDLHYGVTHRREYRIHPNHICEPPFKKGTIIQKRERAVVDTLWKPWKDYYTIQDAIHDQFVHAVNGSNPSEDACE